MSNAPDPLFEIKNAYYIGDYQQCISTVQKLRAASHQQQAIANFFLYRAYVAQKKYRIPQDELKPSQPEPWASVRMYAEYFEAVDKRDESARDRVLAALDEKRRTFATDEPFVRAAFLLTAAQILMDSRDFMGAMKLLHSASEDNIEACFQMTVAQLAINRPDLARKTVLRMQEIDDDATLTQLADASTQMASGGAQGYQNASNIYQDLIDKYQPTVLLLNALAVSKLMQEKFDEADSLLQDALTKDSSHEETLLNLSIVNQHAPGKRDVARRYMRQLKDAHPNSTFVQDIENFRQRFDAECKQYVAKK